MLEIQFSVSKQLLVVYFPKTLALINLDVRARPNKATFPQS